jgi:cytosine/adenosine deaminase-related metal-dependent hydrolase
MPLHAHVSEQVAENEQCLGHHNMTPTQLLHECGAVNSRFGAVHATHLTDEDIATYGSTGSTVCLCPTTERDLGDGIGPAIRLAKADVPMALGSDSHAVIDMFEEARAVELNERLQCQQRGLHPTAELIAMATHHGHRSLGWSDAGTITVGARADLVTLSLDSVRTAGTTIESAAEAVVFAATAADVTQVVADGRPIVTDGRHTSIEVAAELHSTISELMEP